MGGKDLGCVQRSRTMGYGCIGVENRGIFRKKVLTFV